MWSKDAWPQFDARIQAAGRGGSGGLASEARLLNPGSGDESASEVWLQESVLQGRLGNSALGTRPCTPGSGGQARMPAPLGLTFQTCAPRHLPNDTSLSNGATRVQ